MDRLALLLSIVALATAGLALLREPPLGDGLGRGMEAYDFSTARAAYRSLLDAQHAQDVRTMIELGGVVQRERRTTAKVEDEAAFKERRILFVSYRENGEPKHDVVGMKKLHGVDIWVQDYISRYDVKEEDEALAKRMEEWEAQDEK